jgi:hypothetical protein
MRFFFVISLCCACAWAEDSAGKKPSVSELYQQLASPDFDVREAATEALIRRGPAVIAELESLRKSDADSERVARFKTIARLSEFGEYTSLEALEKLRAESLKVMLERKHPEEDGKIVVDLARIKRIIDRAASLAPANQKARVEGEAHLDVGMNMYKLAEGRDQFWIRHSGASFELACKVLEPVVDNAPDDKELNEIYRKASMLRYATRQMTVLPAPHE